MGHRMDWRVIAVIMISVIAWFLGTAAASGPTEVLVKEQAENLKTEQVEKYWNQLMNDYGGYFPENKSPSLMDMLLPGGEGFGLKDMLYGVLRFFLYELMYSGKLLALIVILTVFSLILETVQTAFEKNTVSKVAYSITYIVLIIVAINSFRVAIDYASSAISNMIHFMVAMVPMLLTLLASMGNISSVAVLHPLIVFMIHTIGTVVYMIVFPLLFFSAVLHIVSSLSERYKVTQLANLLRNIGIGILGISLTVFMGVISVQGMTGAAVDGVTLRTAKFITGNFVPVVGRVFTDATDTVIGASLLVKNAIGLVGVIIIMMLCAFPALKILAMALIYNLAAAVTQPLGDSPIGVCLQTIGKSLIYVFAALASVGLMFFLAITIIITAGNVTVMMR